MDRALCPSIRGRCCRCSVPSHEVRASAGPCLLLWLVPLPRQLLSPPPALLLASLLPCCLHWPDPRGAFIGSGVGRVAVVAAGGAGRVCSGRSVFGLWAGLGVAGAVFRIMAAASPHPPYFLALGHRPCYQTPMPFSGALATFVMLGAAVVVVAVVVVVWLPLRVVWRAAALWRLPLWVVAM